MTPDLGCVRAQVCTHGCYDTRGIGVHIHLGKVKGFTGLPPPSHPPPSSAGEAWTVLLCVPSVLLPPSFCFNNSGAPGELFPEFCSVESKILLYVKNVSFPCVFVNAFIQQAPLGPTVVRSEMPVSPLCFNSQLSGCPQVGETPNTGSLMTPMGFSCPHGARTNDSP